MKAKKDTWEEVLTCFTKKHGKKEYDYSDSIFVDLDTVMEIRHVELGVFEMTPREHFYFGHPNRTQNDNGYKALLEKCNSKHNNIYVYPPQSYRETRDRIIIYCKLHGEFSKVASIHANGQGCPTCSRLSKRMPEGTFIAECKERHNNYYDYSLVKYRGKQYMINIICPVHGIFPQKAGDHHRGHGCDKCNKSGGRLCVTVVERDKQKYHKQKGVLYLLECSLEDELFYKSGITSQKIKSRYSSKEKMPYSYKILHEIPMNMYDAFYTEQKIKEDMKAYRYYPKLVFGGHTESLHIDCQEIILKEFEEIALTNPNK